VMIRCGGGGYSLYLMATGNNGWGKQRAWRCKVEQSKQARRKERKDVRNGMVNGLRKGTRERELS